MSVVAICCEYQTSDLFGLRLSHTTNDAAGAFARDAVCTGMLHSCSQPGQRGFPLTDREMERQQ